MINIDKGLKELRNEYSVPGLSVGIINKKEREIFSYGITNINNPTSVDENTLFQIASITKTITALAVMLLSREKIISLDTPIIEYIPEFKMQDELVANTLTARHLLAHLGGWEGDIIEYPDKGEDTLRETMKLIAMLPQLTPLGKVWAYNPSGFYILGYLLEQLLNKPYEKIMEEYVLRPLGMGCSMFTASEAITRKVVAGHYIVNGTPKAATPWEVPRCTRPGSGIITTVSDMLKYLDFLLNPSEIITDGAGILQEMLKPESDASGKADKAGLAWMIRYVNGIEVFRHGGASMGQYSELIFIPELQFGFILLTNGGREGFVDSAANLILKQYTGLTLERALLDVSLIPNDGLSPYIGRYNGFANDIDIMNGNNGLIAKYNYKKVFKNQKVVPEAPSPLDMIFYEPDRAYLRQDGVMCDFIRDDCGNVKFMRHGNKINVKVP